MIRLPFLFWTLVLLLSSVAHAAPPSSSVTSKQNLCLQDEKCRDHYAAANELYKAGKLQAAVTEFEAAYSEIQLPVFLYNLGRLHHRLGNLDQAAGYYRRFLGATADEDPEQRERAKEYLRQVQQSAGEVAAVTPAAQAPLISSAPPPAPAAPPAVEKKPVYKKWWFWTIAGGVVAGVAIGLAVGLAPQNGSVVPPGVPRVQISF